MVWKNCLFVLIAISALGEAPLAVAQNASQGNQAYGMFGNRTLGQPFTPSPSTFGGGIQITPGGSFLTLGRANGVAAFSTPWQHIDPDIIAQAMTSATAAQPAVSAASAPPSTAANSIAPQPPTSTEFAPLLSPDLVPQQAVEANPRPAVAYTAAEAGSGARAAADLAARGQSYALSVDLSGFLTRIARSKGILAGRSIDVYLSNHVARIQGVVRSPADAVLLANVLALEPDVQRIDNRLVPVGVGGPSSY